MIETAIDRSAMPPRSDEEKRRRRRAATLGCAGVLSGFLATSLALSSTQAAVWQRTSPYLNCVQGNNNAQSNHVFSAQVTNWSQNSGSQCSSNWGRPPGQLYVQVNVLKFNGSSYAMCIPGPASTNAANSFIQFWSTTSYCGAGQYNVFSTTQAFDGGNWHGGGFNSGAQSVS